MTNLETIKKQALKNKAFKKAYDESEVHFSIIGQVIKKRNEKGISYEDLANRMRIKQSLMDRFMMGDYDPTLSFLKKLSEALGGKLQIKI